MKTHISEIISNRYSPMIFETRAVSDEDMQILLEAASLAASSYNAQPWRFIFAFRGTEEYELLRSLLSEYNQNWTSGAPVLILSLAQHIDEKGNVNYYGMYDLGQAVSSMALQASSMDMQIHQMGGFDMNKTRELLKIPASYLPGAMIALGYPGDKTKLEGHFRDRAHEPRVRKSVSEISGGTDFFTIQKKK